MAKVIPKIQDLDLKNKRVLIRVDFNTPLKTNENGEREVSDPARIVGALETIRYALDQGAKVILASHLGRPDGKVNQKFTLEPVGRKLSELLNKDIILTDDCVGDGARSLSQQIRAGDVILLENLRFHAGEESNVTEFANKLLELCDVYISDAFGTLHRAHASTSALPKSAPQKGIGFLVQKELENLQPLRENPPRPFVLVTGGAKVSDKIGVIEHFLPKLDRIVIGGAMAYAFLKAQGVEVGKSLCEDKQVQLAGKLIKSARARNIDIYLPQDHVVVKKFDDESTAKVTPHELIEADWMGVDIGPKTIEHFKKALKGAETIFWNGPMGVFEKPAFAKGTFELAGLIAGSKAKKMAGGGDSAAAITEAGFESQFDFISTGGGATLEFLEGKELPGLKALEVTVRAKSPIEEGDEG